MFPGPQESRRAGRDTFRVAAQAFRLGGVPEGLPAQVRMSPQLQVMTSEVTTVQVRVAVSSAVFGSAGELPVRVAVTV
jgi:hypothetical protein